MKASTAVATDFEKTAQGIAAVTAGIMMDDGVQCFLIAPSDKALLMALQTLEITGLSTNLFQRVLIKEDHRFKAQNEAAKQEVKRLILGCSGNHNLAGKTTEGGERV